MKAVKLPFTMNKQHAAEINFIIMKFMLLPLEEKTLLYGQIMAGTNENPVKDNFLAARTLLHLAEDNEKELAVWMGYPEGADYLFVNRSFASFCFLMYFKINIKNCRGIFSVRKAK